MNSAINVFVNRRSIRKYKDVQVDDALLDAVLLAGTYAPTAMGRQSPLIVCVQNREDIEVLRKLNAQIAGSSSDPFYGAPTIILVFAERGNHNGVQDASLVLGNLMNAAYAEGLGSCWINRIKETFELPEGKALLQKWGIEDKWDGVGSCILGYTDGPLAEAKPRREGYVMKIK